MIIEGYVPYSGFKTYYRTVKGGKKTPLLLLHGGPGSTHNYFEVLDRVAYEDGRDVISYDQLGCGNSFIDGCPQLWRMETWLGELEAVRSRLGLEKVFILGQSWGGMLLLEYVCRRSPKGVSGIVLSSTLPSSRLWGAEQLRLISQLPDDERAAIASAVSSGDYSGDAYGSAEAHYMSLHCFSASDGYPECVRRPKRTGRESYEVAWGPNEFTPTGTLSDFDVTDLLKDIKTPALIMSGGSDLCTPYIAKTMYDAIPGAEWVLFRECRHMCFVEDNDGYVSALIRFMNGIEGKSYENTQ